MRRVVSPAIPSVRSLFSAKVDAGSVFHRHTPFLLGNNKVLR